MPFFLLIYFLLKLAIIDIFGLLVAFGFIFYYLLLRKDKFSYTTHLIISFFFISTCSWAAKINDYEFMFVIILVFGVFKTITLNVKTHTFLVEELYPNLTFVNKTPVSFNIFYSKALETVGEKAISLTTELASEYVSKNPETQKKVGEFIKIAIDHGLNNRNKIAAVGLSSTLILGYQYANYKYKASQKKEVTENFAEAIFNTNHYKNYTNKNPVFEDKLRVEFEDALVKKQLFVPRNLSDDLIYQAYEKAFNPEFLVLLELGEIVKSIT
jgi:hypothetical protein